jgi:hypothetical protein
MNFRMVMRAKGHSFRSLVMMRAIGCRKALSVLGIVFSFLSRAGVADTFTTVDYPGGDYTTSLRGIDGDNYIGNNNSVPGGFLYDGTTFKTILDPLSANGMTWPYGISGGTVVGTYADSKDRYHGFVYDGSTYTSLPEFSLASSGSFEGTSAMAICGSNIVGNYTTNPGGASYNLVTHGFL